MLIQGFDGALKECNIGVTDGISHFSCSTTGQSQHLAVAVDPDHPAFSSNHLGTDEGVFAAAASQIQHTISGANPAGWISTSVIALHHCIWNHSKQGRIKPHRRAKAGFLLLSSCAVTVFNRLRLIEGC